MVKRFNLRAELLFTSMCCHTNAWTHLGGSYLTPALRRPRRVLGLLWTLSISSAKSSEGLVTILRCFIDAIKCLVLPSPAALGFMRWALRLLIHSSCGGRLWAGHWLPKVLSEVPQRWVYWAVWEVWSEWADVICGCNRVLRLWRPVRCSRSAALWQNSHVSVNWAFLALKADVQYSWRCQQANLSGGCQGTRNLVSPRLSSSLAKAQWMIFWINLLKEELSKIWYSRME